MALIIDGIDGVISLVENERAEALEAARCATKREARARAMGRVAMANSLLATLLNAHLSVGPAPDGSYLSSYPSKRDG